MKKELIAHLDPKSPISEVFRSLRTNIQFMNAKGTLKTLLITSTLPGEGKSWTASNLAVTFAQAGKKVLLIDADMRKGRLYSIFGVSPKPGLSNYLSGVNDVGMEMDSDIVSYIRETQIDNLFVIPAGNVPPNPSELLISDKMIELLESLKTMCDIVIIDGTPSLMVTDSVILSRMVDATIIVVSHKMTKIDDLNKVKKDIKNVGGNIIGTIINRIPVSAKKYENSYYYGANSSKQMTNTRGRSDIETLTQYQKRQLDSDIKLYNKTEENISKTTTVEKEPTVRLANNIELETNGAVSIEKTEEILKQLNQYLDVEKNRLGNKGD